MSTQYYLTTGNNKLGPLTEKNIVDGVRSGKISLFDMILNNQTGEWMMLAQHPDFSDLDDTSKSEESSEQSDHLAVGLISDTDSGDNLNLPEFITPDNFPILTPVYWYEKDHTDRGLKYFDVLALVHSHKLSEQSLISKNPQGPWQPLISWDEFSPKSIEEYKKISTENLPEVHVRRKTQRFNSGKVFIALSKKNQGFQIFCADISKSGLGFLVRSAKFSLNDELMIKFDDKLQDSKFDAKGVIVSIRKVRLPGAENVYVRYGFRFTALSEAGKKYLLKATA